MSEQCNHNFLRRLEGPLHPSGNEYYCSGFIDYAGKAWQGCGQQFKTVEANVTVTFPQKEEPKP